MDELSFLLSLSSEVIKSEDPRLRQLLEWCDNIEKSLGTCGGKAPEQHNQAAAAASELLLGANYIEESGEPLQPHFVPTILNRKDNALPLYFYRADFEKRTITFDVAVADPITAIKEHRPSWSVAPLVMSMREVEGDMPTESKSLIVMPD